MLSLIVLLCTSLLAACGGGATSDTNGAVKDELVVALPGDIDNFDPHTNQLITYQYAVKALVFNSLVRYDTSLNIVPDLAKSFDVNADATELTFELEPDAKFQDGTAVTADAVIQSLDRAAAIKGSVWAPRLAGVEDMTAEGDTTVSITLKAPDASFLGGLTDISIIAPSGFEDVKSKPVGSGPYSFVSWKPNSEIRLERFDEYFGEKPQTKTIVEKPVADAQVALNNLYSGSVDIIASSSAATAKQVDSSRAEVVTPESSNSLSLIEFNSSGKLSDVRVRQALAYALDKAAVKGIAYGGEGESIWSPLPPSSWAYKEPEGYDYDLDKAKQLLDEAGVQDLEFTVEILSGYPDANNIARVWQESLAEIGVTLHPRVSELSVWLDHYVNRDYDATWNSFNVGPDPSSYFDIIMTPHLGDDFKNPEMSDLIGRAKETSNQEERATMYQELQDMMVEQIPVMTVQTVPATSIVSPKVSDYEMNPLGWALFGNAASRS